MDAPGAVVEALVVAGAFLAVFAIVWLESEGRVRPQWRPGLGVALAFATAVAGMVASLLWGI